MALTSKQRNRLPRSAFLDPRARRFPAPTKAQARAAGISEAQRLRTLRNALARAAQSQARGVKTVSPALVRRKVKARTTARQIPSVRAGSRRRGRRRR